MLTGEHSYKVKPRGKIEEIKVQFPGLEKSDVRSSARNLNDVDV